MEGDCIVPMILNLPDDVFREILNVWIEINTVGMLDVALSNAMLRSKFNSLLPFLTNGTATNSHIIDYCLFDEWSRRKSIKLTGLLFDSGYEFPLLCPEAVRQICIKDYDDVSKFANTFDKCLNLNALICVGVDRLQVLGFPVLSRLKELSVKNGQHDIPKLLFNMIGCCRNLVTLRIEFNVDYEQIMVIMMMNPNLTDLHASTERSLFPVIQQHCPLIKRVSLVVERFPRPFMQAEVDATDTVKYSEMVEFLRFRPAVRFCHLWTPEGAVTYSSEQYCKSFECNFESISDNRSTLLNSLSEINEFKYFCHKVPEFLVDWLQQSSLNSLTSVSSCDFELIKRLLSNHPNITSVRMESNNFSKSILTNCSHQLLSLTVSSYSFLSPAYVMSYIKMCPNLKEGYFQRVDKPVDTDNWWEEMKVCTVNGASMMVMMPPEKYVFHLGRMNCITRK